MSLDLPVVDALDFPTATANTSGLSKREKAAIVVLLLLGDGAVPALAELSEDAQTGLVLLLGTMRPVGRDVVDAVVEEFILEAENMGLAFPSGVENALGMLDGIISPAASSRVRKGADLEFRGDPWDQVNNVDVDKLVTVLEAESIEVGAVILSKLKVSTAAEILGQLPGERARRITYAISLTGSIAPRTVRKIGISLAQQLNTRPARAFSDGPVTRVGAILNYSPASTRDDVLDGLDAEDHEFAEQVRRAIFTFANIKERVSPRDVPRIQRDFDQADLVLAVAAASGSDKDSVDFILENISQRLAESIRTEAAEAKGVNTKDAEAAMTRIVAVVRELEKAGEIFLVAEDA